MSLWKTFAVLALCLIAYAALAAAQDSASGSASASGSENGSGSNGGAPGSKPSKSGAMSSLQVCSPWVALASLIGTSLYFKSA